jgi:cytochrome c biogenesis protein CcmG/thiol:disulfide interchange protein DsbE
MKRNLQIAIVLALIVGGMFLAARRHVRRGASAPLGGAITTVRGQSAPDFQLVDLRTGKNVQLSDFRGKAVVLNFWATWCPPCKAEIPWFEAYQNQYGPQGLQVIGIAMDDAGKDVILKFAGDMRINYLVLQGTNKVADDYGGVEGLPTTFYIGRDGRVVARAIGEPSRGDIEDNIKLALHTGQAAVTEQASQAGVR